MGGGQSDRHSRQFVLDNIFRRHDRREAEETVIKRDQDFFWEGIDQGKLLVQKCAQCEKMRHPPAPMCAVCQSLEWIPHELSGKGKVFSWLVSTHPTDPTVPPRTVVLVELEEGIRLVSNLVEGETTEIGQPVELAISQVGELTLPLFRNARNGARA